MRVKAMTAPSVRSTPILSSDIAALFHGSSIRRARRGLIAIQVKIRIDRALNTKSVVSRQTVGVIAHSILGDTPGPTRGEVSRQRTEDARTDAESDRWPLLLRFNEIRKVRERVMYLFIVTAAIEVGAALVLLLAPAVVIRLLFGSAVEVFPAAGIARLTGVALLSLGTACWWARDDERSAASRAIVGAMLIYNAGVVALVLAGVLGSLGPIQWAAVVLHGALGIWCARIVAARRR